MRGQIVLRRPGKLYLYIIIYYSFNIFQRTPGRPVVRGRVRQIPFLFKRDASPLY